MSLAESYQKIERYGKTIWIKKNSRYSNVDIQTVRSFGKEWLKFHDFTEEEISQIGEEYFDIVDLASLKDAYVLDAGCGSGRWSKFLCSYVKSIEAIDPSEAVWAAAEVLKECNNVRIIQTEINDLPFSENTFDFVMCLGVLHHIPDHMVALKSLVKVLKKDGHILLYLYYNLDNKPFIYRLIFKISSMGRYVISRLPHPLKVFVSDIIALLVYYPLSRFSKIIKSLFPRKKWYKYIPLYYYADKNFKIMRNDSLDRFGTRLEKRFSRKEIEKLLESVGLKEIIFSSREPFYHVLARK